jgi:hypothetical protein
VTLQQVTQVSGLGGVGIQQHDVFFHGQP